MRISSSSGTSLDLSVVGYQFPNAEDRAQRYSWHMVRGTVTDRNASWHVYWQALACDESSRVGPWLRSLATCIDEAAAPGAPIPSRLAFTEPNLAFAVMELRPGGAQLRVELDVEFHRDRAHWAAGDPYLLDLDVTAAQLFDAADQWDEEVSHYPDGSP